MTSRRYNAAHWGVYEVQQGGKDGITLAPFAADPSPNRIGLDQRSPDVMRLRIVGPAIRRTWLDRKTRGRRGDSGPDAFVTVPWDEAVEIVADEYRRITSTHGNEAVFGGSYGWASAGRFHHAQSQLHRFLNLSGGYVRSVDSYSLGAGRVIMPYVAAPLDTILNEATSWDVIAAHTRLFVTFGGVSPKSAQVSSGGASTHRVPQGLHRAAAAGVRFINISPVADNIDTGAGVTWIPIRPNTDTALMLALIHEMDRTATLDRAFLESHCTGAEQFLAYIRGTTGTPPCDASWAERITGVPSATIRALAVDMAATRTMLNCAWSLQRASHGEQPFWTIMALAACLGQIGLPGGGFALGYGAMNSVGSPHMRLKGPTLDQGKNPVVRFIPVARIADMLLAPGSAFTYEGKTHHYPDIRLVWWAGGNPFHHHQDTNRLRQALRRPDTIIVQDPYWTPMARAADIVLPTTTTLERNDLGYATLEGMVIAMQRAADPHAHALDDHAILARIAQKLGFLSAFTEGRTEMEWLRALYDGFRTGAAKRNVTTPDFDTFWDQGLLDLGAHARPKVLFEAFRANPLANPLPTRSGRLELYCEALAELDLPDCLGHPAWLAPTEWLGSPLTTQYPLHLISDQPATRLHSQLDHASLSRRAKIHGREPVYISPCDAVARNINAGDIVELFNGRGACLAAAIPDPAIMPGVVRLSTGAWSDADGLRDNHGNPNVLTRDQAASGLSQGCAAHTCLVEVRLFTAPVPPVMAFRMPTLESAF
ncbi:molybdopterin-dependent oxidoreductase [Acetobacter fallax]|uniref:Molybdopterin-dependent oxidoreductase n=1 Tax=Acetobacter fallax TaxID=1737473 RepID=A0ABX0KHA2_9PROT|nr:molybdopterin-dependent oxidoreductase [Acetobacter fallax]NHO33795.1 molybdopterin-dependent oxidoreductase [Acetobacter fallax]NHO37356.1 molybdopterin-dependent oxidoreductase [Acetobacter fallax]